MSVEIRVPQLGESIVEATVGRWLKAEGETVEMGEPVVELETEKVNLEVPAPGAGTVQSIQKHEGDTVGVDEVLGLIGAEVQAEQPAAATGAAPKMDPALAAEPAVAAVAPTVAGDGDGGVRATPLAKRMAAELGVDLALVPGSGPAGRVTREDVTTYLESRPATSAGAQQANERQTPAPATVPATQASPAAGAGVSAGTSPQPSTVAAAPGAREERRRMSRRRLTIARRLVEAQHTAAMLTTFNEVDMTAILDVRKRRRDAFRERHGVGLGFMSFFTKAVVGALKAFPLLNSEIQGDEIVLKQYYDIGIAVSTDEGLVVPVVRDADRLSFADIERQVADLATKARNRELSLSDLQGGTFTITNGGIFGSLLSTPILNYPQVGILGMHKIEERPIALNGEVVIRPMMYVALSYDHRIVDGSEAVQFLVRCKQLLEDPEALLLEG